MGDAQIIPLHGDEPARRAASARARSKRAPKPPIGPASADPEPVDPEAAERAPVERAPAARAPAAAKAASRKPADRVSADQAPGDQAPGDWKPADRKPADRPPAGAVPVDRAAAAAEAVEPGLTDPGDVAPTGDQPAGDGRPDWERSAATALAFLRRRLTGEYEVDEFGFDPDLAEHVLAAPFRPMYDRWFRVEAQGLENIPDVGGALLVGNHSGTLPLDAVMTTLALLDHHPAHRHLRLLGADLVFQLPVVGEVSRKAGHTLACAADAERLLGNGELVGVWPEGFKGLGKPFSERYKLQRFGRGGFVSTALRVGVPIIPCSIVGAEEIYPMVANVRTLARIIGVPYFPLTPTFPWLGLFGMVPLPSKWLIEFGEPIDTADLDPSAADDPMVVFNITDQVRETIQQTLYRLLLQRKSVFR